MDNVSISNQDSLPVTEVCLDRLLVHEIVRRREPDRPEAALSPEELLTRFRAADPTRKASYLPWLIRTYVAEGYRLEDLPKARDTLKTFARLRERLECVAIIDGETRNPRKLGSHMTLASLWTVIAPLVEAENLLKKNETGEHADAYKRRALAQSRVLHRSERMVVAVPMTEEASCWWGRGTQWCTAARKYNAFNAYHRNAPLIVVCLRKNGELSALKLQIHVNYLGTHLMDENDAPLSPSIILERWQDLVGLLHWAVMQNGNSLQFIPERFRTEALCLVAVGSNGRALEFVPEHLHTEEMCLAAVKQYGGALQFIPKHLSTAAICLAAVGRSGWALKLIPEHLLTETLCNAAIMQSGLSIQFVPEHLRTEALYMSAVTQEGQALKFINEYFCTEAICLAAVTQNGLAIKFIPNYLHTEALCFAAVIQSGRALMFVPENFRTEILCLAAVTQDGNALEFVPDNLYTAAICLAAVKRFGSALKYVPEHLRTDEICLAAVGSYGMALEHVPEYLCTPMICMVAVGRHGDALKFIPEHLRAGLICPTEIKGGKKEIIFVIYEDIMHGLILDSLENMIRNSLSIY